MLLQSLRRSRALAHLVLVWFVLAMGVAVAAPAVQPLPMLGICSASAASDSGQPDGNAARPHASLQCILCISAGAPPMDSVVSLATDLVPEVQVPALATVVVVAPRNSPLRARAPPAL